MKLATRMIPSNILEVNNAAVIRMLRIAANIDNDGQWAKKKSYIQFEKFAYSNSFATSCIYRLSKMCMETVRTRIFVRFKLWTVLTMEQQDFVLLQYTVRVLL